MELDDFRTDIKSVKEELRCGALEESKGASSRAEEIRQVEKTRA